HFTKYGARKIAHYVERELRRFISNRSIPTALPTDVPATPMAPDGRPGSAVRPVAGPVVPLTVAPGSENEELMGGNATRPTFADPTATRVLVRGEPVAAPPGRADDFSWPRAGEANAAVEPISPTAAAAQGVPEAPRGAAKDAKKGGKAEAKADSKTDPRKLPKSDQRQQQTPSQIQRPASGNPPRPAQQVQQQRQARPTPFGWFR
ncbi:MAG: DUF459 domain-containing protein, partial [Pseudolabrys sp.]|nr:DUF459 domain-containing protein [Pseudolabrys sp.]